MKLNALLVGILTLSLLGCATPPHNDGAVQLSRNEISSQNGFCLSSRDRLVTPGSFKPPVEISIVAKTDSTNLRIAYAADQIIFNWELNPQELRVNGGPADGMHKQGAGHIPIDKYVHIKWLVTPQHQAIYVDKELRFEHSGDYSGINKPVWIFPAAGSTVTIKSLKVKQLRDLTTTGEGKAEGRSGSRRRSRRDE